MTLSQHVLYGLFVCAQDPKILSRNFQILPLYTLHTDDICLDFTCMFIYMFNLFRFCLIVCSLLVAGALNFGNHWIACGCACMFSIYFSSFFYWCAIAFVCVCVRFLGEIVFFFNLGFCVCVSSIHNNSTCIRAIHRDTKHH